MLQKKAEADPMNHRYCSIMLDGMSLRKHLDWDPKRQEMVGFVDLGSGSLDCDAGEATEALVVMAVGLQGQWKVPIGYFLINGISAEVQCQLLLSMISALYDINVNVVALVMDGHSTNQKMANVLGCSTDADNIKSSFPHPSNSSRNIHVFFDACHLLKNLRGALHALGQIETCVGKAKWEDIVLLHELQTSEGLRAANKLTTKHIRFQKNKMNVKLAAQTMSASVAAALRFASQMGCDGLGDCAGTANFVSVIDHMFDIFNSRTPVAKGFKSPLRPGNLAYTEQFLLQAKSVLLSMTDRNGTKVYQGKRRMGVIGFLCNIESVLKLSKELLLGEAPVQRYLLTYKLSQDHLEMYFSSVRQRGGWNNNPSALQFCSAFRSLLGHAGVSITGSAKSNCVPQDTTSLLSVVVETDPDPDVIVPAITFESALCDHTYSVSKPGLSTFVEGVVEYIAGWVVRAVSKKISCNRCAIALVRPASECTSALLKLKNNGGLVVPSLSVVRIVRHCEIVLRSCINVKKVVCGQWEQMLVSRMLLELPTDLFVDLKDHFIVTSKGIDTHCYIMTKLICESFLKVRRYHTVNLTNLSLAGDSVRHHLNKTVLFKHQ